MAGVFVCRAGFTWHSAAPPHPPVPGHTWGVSEDGVSLFATTDSSSSEPWATFSLCIHAFLGVWVGGHSGQCCRDHGVPLALGRTDTVAFRCLLSGLAGSCGSSSFRFWRNLPSASHGDCTSLHSHQECTWGLVSAHARPCLFLMSF